MDIDHIKAQQVFLDDGINPIIPAFPHPRIAATKEHTETLRQSVLAQAFSGQLVPTEAELARREGREYETASELLERIRGKGKEGR